MTGYAFYAQSRIDILPRAEEIAVAGGRRDKAVRDLVRLSHNAPAPARRPPVSAGQGMKKPNACAPGYRIWGRAGD